MGTKNKLAITFASITTILYALSMATPWWYTVLEYSEPDTPNSHSNCWIDGTCRTKSWVYKDNGSAQCVFDTTLILMLVSMIPFISFWHGLLWRRSGRFGASLLSSVGFILFTGFATVGLYLSAVLVFAIKIVNKTNYDEFYGTQSLVYPFKIVEWGPSFGWFFAIVACVMLLPAVMLAVTITSETTGYTLLTNDTESASLLPPSGSSPSSSFGFGRKKYSEDRSKKAVAQYVAKE